MRLLKLIFLLLSILACSSDDQEIIDHDHEPEIPLGDNCNLVSGWLIDPSLIIGGGVGKDGIPSLDDPTFISRDEVDFLKDNELVIGINTGDQTLLFPHRIIDRHEIVNGQADNFNYTMTFCPLTGSAIGFCRGSDGSFGVSGLLHNSNLIYFDRKNDSHWSQMLLTSIRGPSVCKTINVLNLIEMTWKEWKQQSIDFKVLSINTGFDKDYSQSFSELIELNDTPLWPYSPQDTRLENFERVYVLFIDSRPKAYPLNAENSLSIIKDTILGTRVILITYNEAGLITAFYDEGGEYSIESQSEGIIIRKQNKSWDIFGKSFNDEHEDLTKPNGYTAYWFSVGAMFPGIELYNQDGKD
ncbi:DUF3179 domain-containing (seleno)protein [Ekhidna sp.]|uniref:DUF3179 domain-containing (seleno)protein n=1 Tax=Ekhidna sp. TaxID=2608089 RepID=UPI003BAC7E37